MLELKRLLSPHQESAIQPIATDDSVFSHVPVVTVASSAFSPDDAGFARHSTHTSCFELKLWNHRRMQHRDVASPSLS